MEKKQPIPLILLDTDACRLKQLIGATAYQKSGSALLGEIDKAKIVSQAELPEDVVIMNSTVEIEDLEDGDLTTYRLVYPKDADADTCKISILAPIGTALIGYKKGDIIQWKMPGGVRKLRITSVTQPQP